MAKCRRCNAESCGQSADVPFSTVIPMTAAQTLATDLAVDGRRLWNSLMELARIGATEKGGVCRVALTDLDRQGRELVMQWARGAGLAITVDRIGNVFMRRSGRDNTLP